MRPAGPAFLVRPRRSASWRLRRPCAWFLLHACGARLPRACAPRRLRARCGRWSRGWRGGGPLPRRSCVLRLRARGNRRAHERGDCALPRSACAARRRRLSALRGGRRGACAGRTGLAAGAGCAPRFFGASTGSGFALWLRPGRRVRRFDLLDDDLLAAAMAEALAHHARLGARLQRQRRFFTPEFFVSAHSGTLFLVRPSIPHSQSVHRRRAHRANCFGSSFRSESAQSASTRARKVSLPGPASRAACTTFERFNAKSNWCRRKYVDDRDFARDFSSSVTAQARRRACVFRRRRASAACSQRR